MALGDLSPEERAFLRGVRDGKVVNTRIRDMLSEIADALLRDGGVADTPDQEYRITGDNSISEPDCNGGGHE